MTNFEINDSIIIGMSTAKMQRMIERLKEQGDSKSLEEAKILRRELKKRKKEFVEKTALQFGVTEADVLVALDVLSRKAINSAEVGKKLRKFFSDLAEKKKLK